MLIKRLLVVNDSISNKFKSLVQGKINYWYDTIIPNEKFSFKKFSKIINKQGIHNTINKEYMINKEHMIHRKIGIHDVVKHYTFLRVSVNLISAAKITLKAVVAEQEFAGGWVERFGWLTAPVADAKLAIQDEDPLGMDVVPTKNIHQLSSRTSHFTAVGALLQRGLRWCL